MNSTNTNASAVSTDGMATDTAEVDETDTTPIAYAKGSWQDDLQKSSNLLDRAGKNRKQASSLLWKGAKEGINIWLPTSATDVSGEALYSDVIEALGKARKGDASKIKTVAVAVRNNSLDISTFPNLSKAYAAARALTTDLVQHQTEDDAAEKAVAAIDAPSSTRTVDGAAALLLSKGVDGAVVAILDALGAKNFDAHRAFVRAMATEVSARVQAAKPKPAPKPAKPAGAKPAKKAAAKKAAAPVAAKKKKGKPATKGKPAAKAEVKDAQVEAPAETQDNTAETSTTPVVTKAKGKGRPVVKRPGK